MGCALVYKLVVYWADETAAEKEPWKVALRVVM